jgi:NitT/TauT family transport system substrate-binding protein
VINEAARTLLYLPLYHAIEKGYFSDEGIDVQIVTGGTASNSFTAMLGGQAQFSQADPMYVPISRQSGADTKVVGQIVGRIAVWGVTLDPAVKNMGPSALRGKIVSTHIRPMTAYTYTSKLIQNDSLRPDIDVKILQSQPGTELVPLLTHRADFAMTIEPQVSQAVQQGAHVVFSYPQQLGNQVFTGLMARADFIASNQALVKSVLKAYQRALDDIHANPEATISTAIKYFPQLDQQILKAAITRVISEQVIPKSLYISEESWNKAVAVRLAAGDLHNPAPAFSDCVDQSLQSHQ